MIEQLRFYLSHSFNDLSVNRRLTFFAILSIAAGVAAIVSLQTLSVMIGDTLEQNLQETNRGDVSAQIVDGFGDGDGLAEYIESGVLQEETISFFGQSGSLYTFSPQGIEELQSWIDSSEFAGEVKFTYRVAMTDPIGLFTGNGRGTNITETETGTQISQVSPVVIDPTVYPYYSDIVTVDGSSLADVLQSPTDIVVGRNIADELLVDIGDTVTINGSSATFTVRGIVEIESEVRNPVTDVFAGLFGFYYINLDSVASFEGFEAGSNIVYFKLDDASRAAEFNEVFSEAFPFFETVSTDDLREQNEELVGQLDQLTTIMGLVSLLLGSIGIINTMQVVVRRRMLEVAVLKTIGMQSEQVTFLFLTEAFLMGVIGSLVGIVLGWVGTFIIKGGVESIFGTTLPFSIAPLPALNGFVVGVVVATVFGFLPTLAAGQVRPGIVLRPAQGAIPKAGRLQTLGAIALIIVMISLIAQSILGSFVLALQVVAGAFIAAGIVYGILWVIIWLIGRLFPSFGLVDLKVSLRQMLVSKGRGASTLLALVVGVFSLSLITLFAQSINNILTTALEGVGGNVFVSMQSYNQLEEVEAIINSVDGVNDYSVILSYNAELVSWEDTDNDTVVASEELTDYVLALDIDFPPFFQGSIEEKTEIQQEILDGILINTSIESREIMEAEDATMTLGRGLTPEDAETPVIVLQEAPMLLEMGVNPGDRLIYRISSQSLLGGRSEDVTFEVVGIESAGVSINTGSGVHAPAGAFPENINPSGVTIMVDIDEEQIPALRHALSEVPGTFALNTAIFTRLISSFVSTFTAFPLLVAALGLVVGGVVIANSVALSTMERQHEIAVMKAVGLQRERVLGMLLLENGILGFIGGLIGVGIGLVSLVAFATTSEVPLDTIPWGTAFLLMMLCVGVAIIAAITSAWSASGEKPLTVLRYE